VEKERISSWIITIFSRYTNVFVYLWRNFK
jgi:hypothetical protein